MPFGLENIGATSLRLMNKTIKNQIGRNIEVDDIMVKLEKAENHLKDLKDTFANLAKVRLNLKANKCAFKVSKGKFLRYMVTKEGIKPHLEKVQVVINMKAPRTIKDVQRLNDAIAALSRFIPRSANRCLYFFKLPRAKKKGGRLVPKM